jgi:hypothetical protein
MVKLKKRIIKKADFKKSINWEIPLTFFLVGFLIILLISIIYFVYYPKNIFNKSNKLNGPLKELSSQGEIISNMIMSEGYPVNWQVNLSEVVKIGILGNNSKVNQEKLDKFYYLTQNDYVKTKELFNTRYDYLFCFSEKEKMKISEIGEISCIGKPGINKENIPARDLFKITRFVIYNGKPVTANIYIWE